MSNNVRCASVQEVMHDLSVVLVKRPDSSFLCLYHHFATNQMTQCSLLISSVILTLGASLPPPRQTFSNLSLIRPMFTHRVPPTSIRHAETAVKIARENGLVEVDVGNAWLLGDYY